MSKIIVFKKKKGRLLVEMNESQKIDGQEWMI